MFNQLSGINAILYYLNDIFNHAGFSKVSGNLQAVAIGATNLLFTMIAMSVIDRLGRKTLLLVGSVGTGLCLAGVSGLQAAIGAHLDPVTQPVPHQRCLGLGEAQLPGRAGVLDGRQRGGAGAAVVAGDEHVVGVRLAHPGRHVPTPDSATSFTPTRARGFTVLRSVMSCARSSIE